jgi:hypothetical protein
MEGHHIFSMCSITSSVPPELQSQGVDDAARNLVLNHKDVGKLAIIAARPHGEVVAHANQLGGDPQSLAGAQDRALQDVIGSKLLARLADFSQNGKAHAEQIAPSVVNYDGTRNVGTM